MKKRLVRIDELKFDWDLYPRLKLGWLTAYQYAQAMRANAVFPPIVVGEFEGEFWVVDGWHRVEALKMLGEQFVEAVVKRFESKRDMFVEAIKLNASHGRPLSVQEKVRLIHRLKEMKFEVEKISEIVKVPIDRIKRFESRTVIGPNGKPVYLKSVVAKASETKEQAVSVDQDKFNVRSVNALLEQLIELLESGVFPWEDAKTKELAVRLYGLLGEGLELKVEAR